jgi:hypothetical protein
MALRIGLALVVLGSIVWLAIPAAPLLSASAAEAAGLATVLFIVAEVTFWGGVALAGKDAWTTVRSNPWRQLPAALWAAFRDGRTTA